MSKFKVSFRVGKVQAYRRGKIWYLCYHENGVRRRPRVGPDRKAAKQMAAQINGQLEVGAPAALSFEPISIAAVRDCWLQHHEQVLRSSVQTIHRYRTATDHLLRFLEQRPVKVASQFHSSHAEEFVRYLRTIKVSPNGHANTAKRTLLDKGVQFILECCRTLFSYAARRRHLSPYAENPFRALELDRIPVENARPIHLFDSAQERAFLETCDDWQFPVFLTLFLTGMRPGELCHLVLPEDLDWDAGLIRVRNKAKLGWQVKTRNERDLPLHPVLAEVLRASLQGRRIGPVFRRRQMDRESTALHSFATLRSWEDELNRRIAAKELEGGQILSRQERQRLARRLWREQGCVEEDRVRTEFMKVTKAIGLPEYTAPKMLRHLFATMLQEGRVDPLIRNELMGHVTSGDRSASHGLAMTAVYTHTRPETRRLQLEQALQGRPAVVVAQEWLTTAWAWAETAKYSAKARHNT